MPSPSFKSDYFKDIEEAISVADKLVTDDEKFASDRQIVANFYNGREMMSQIEAEGENVGSVVNHLFGYNAIDKLRSQITRIMTSGNEIWKITIKHPSLHIQEQDSVSAKSTQFIGKRLRKSRRLLPEHRAWSGNLVLHGRGLYTFADRFDWCPRSSFLYVPSDCPQNREGIPYAFSAAKLSCDQLESYLKHAKAGGSNWNLQALQDAVESMKPGGPTSPLVDKTVTGEKEAENTNQSEPVVQDGMINTRSALPVWYLYEVDHTKPDKPVGLKIIARYSMLAPPVKAGSVSTQKDPDRDSLLFQQEAHFKSVKHWLVPGFIDTEIGGEPLWNSSVGLGKLNYGRDADVEEFFNDAMAGAKDSMRTKWAVADGANREKIARFFAARQDLLPEGLNPVKVDTAGNWQHALGIIGTLRQLSAEDAGSGVTNNGNEADELEIQAAERQSAAQLLVASRMDDIYDALDDLGAEIVRRFFTSPIDEKNKGYCDIAIFRQQMALAGFPADKLKELAEQEYGEMKWIEVKTIRSVGDGSRVAELQGMGQLMAGMGSFSPEGQEMIKKRYALALTKDPDWVEELVPYQRQTDPDQLARARNENTAAISRGVIGFTPQISNDDVHELHVPEHDSELDAALKRAEDKGGMDESSFAGFRSLATHQGSHLNYMRNDKAKAEAANAWLQKLERQATTAQGLYQAFQKNMQSEELTKSEQIKFQQNAQAQALKERQQSSIEQDRADRIELDRRDQARKEAETTAKAATAMANVTAPQPPEPSPV